MSSVKLSRIESLFTELSYPITRAEAAEEFADVTLLLADGEGNLGEYIADCPSDRFESHESLYEDLQSALPVEALGEPGQSEGDG